MARRLAIDRQRLGHHHVRAAVWFSPDPFDEVLKQRYPSDKIVWKQEGVDSTVVVLESPSHDLSLTVRGNHQASTDPATTYVHRRIGHLPMILHPEPRMALVIGLGGGATAGAVSIHAADVDLVELAEAVIDTAPFFERISYGVLKRPNVHLRVDDGRNYLMLTPRRYDVITADVIHPIFAGSVNLYSLEYFKWMRHVLNPGGIVVQWVAGTEEEYKIIARTLLSVSRRQPSGAADRCSAPSTPAPTRCEPSSATGRSSPMTSRWSNTF